MCQGCRRRFDDLTGTNFAGHRQPLRVRVICLYFMGLNLAVSRKPGHIVCAPSIRISGVEEYVPKVAMRSEVGASPRAVFDAPNRAEAERQLELAVTKYRKTAPRLAEWVEVNVPEGLTAFAVPSSHRRRLRTTNMLERINREIKRRTGVATLFPNEASALRLVSAVLMEISEEWETNRKYVTMEPE